MIATLPVPAGIDIGSELEEEAKVLTSPFGNGYAQRVGDGLKTVYGRYNITISNLTTAQADALRDFLRAHGGYQPFLFERPGAGSATAWICKSWSRTPQDPGYFSLSCTLEEAG